MHNMSGQPPPSDPVDLRFAVDSEADAAMSGHAVQIGRYRVWLAFDWYATPDELTVYLDLGQPGGIEVAHVLNLVLRVSAFVHDAYPGTVVVHPGTGNLLYRFRYALDADPFASDLMEALGRVIAHASTGGRWQGH